jgi:tetratricopeptide (TPR) repeat protein
MRTRQALADELRAAGRLEDAASHYAEMLRLNPGDNQGVRHALLGIRLEQADAAAAADLLDRYDDDVLASSLWARVLERFLAGDRRGANRALRRARRRNRHVERELLSPQPVHPMEQSYALGSEAEAAVARHDLGRAWRRNRRALDWLADGGPSTTAEEHRAAVASYASPVASLLTRGEPRRKLTSSIWRDAAPTDLTAADVPELIRMATDMSLHESPVDASWAPLHAWRALAALRATEAVGPLTDLARDLYGEDWVADELPYVLAALAPASLAPLGALLADRDAEAEARGLAARALEHAVAVDPTTRGSVCEALLAELRRFRENRSTVNGSVIASLVGIDPEAAHDALALIREAFQERYVDEDITGSLEDVVERLT